MFRLFKFSPPHGWNAVAWELGIVVIGVLIALGAQQVAEDINDRYLARQAEDHIRAELAYNSAFASERVATGDCIRSSIVDVRQRLLASGDDWPGLQGMPLAGAARMPASATLFAFAPALSAPHRIWPVSAWAAATNSTAFNSSRSRFFSYAALYAMVDWLGRLQDHEIADYSRLMPFDAAQKLDPSVRLELLRDLGTVDADNADAERLAAVFVTAARRNGISPDPVWLQRAVMPQARWRGACVKQGPALDAAVAREFSLDSRL